MTVIYQALLIGWVHPMFPPLGILVALTALASYCANSIHCRSQRNRMFLQGTIHLEVNGHADAQFSMPNFQLAPVCAPYAQNCQLSRLRVMNYPYQYIPVASKVPSI